MRQNHATRDTPLYEKAVELMLCEVTFVEGNCSTLNVRLVMRITIARLEFRTSILHQRH